MEEWIDLQIHFTQKHQTNPTAIDLNQMEL